MAKELKKNEGGEVALPKDWQEELAQKAADSSASVRPTSSVISLKAGIVSVQGIQAPDNKLDLVIIDFAQEHTLYKTKWDPDNVSPPDCYAIAPGEADLKDIIPAENVPNPEATGCDICPMLKWGSDLNGGKGKACKQHYKLIAIPADALDSSDTVLSAEAAVIKLPVTSGKVWAQYVQMVSALHKRPPWAVLTTLSAVPDVKTQFKATFNLAGLVDFEKNPELYTAIQTKIGLVNKALMQGYDLDAQPASEPNKDAKYAD